MANWSNPLITTQYDVFVNEAKDRDVDSATMFLNAPTNQPVGAIKLQRTPTIFQEWSGSVWQDKILAVSGGGTGASTQSGAVAGLGLGTMAMQNSNAVNITGGVGTLSYLLLHSTVNFAADNTYDVGTNAVRPRKMYIRDALVIPAGVDKFATS
jgi:hypothetical protein